MTPQRRGGVVLVEGSVRHRLWQGLGLLLAVIVAAGLALTLGDYRLTQFAQVIPYAVAVLGLNLLTGYGGQVSLGHGAFFGLGAYTTAILFTNHGWPYLATLPVAGLFGLVLGLAVGIPALRLRGIYLAVVTLAVGIAFPVVVSQPFAVDAGSGGLGGITVFVKWIKPRWFSLNVSDTGWTFLTMAVIAAALFWLATNLVRSRVGRALMSLRDNETAAAAAGVWPAGIKTGVFAVSALYGALGGALYVLVTPVVSPESIGFQITLLFITAMVLGGACTVSGAWLGGLAMVFLPFYTSQWAGDLTFLNKVSSQPGLFSNVIYGGLLIVVVYLMPQGIAPFLTSLRARFVRVIPAEALPPAGTPIPPTERAPARRRPIPIPNPHPNPHPPRR